MKKEYFLLFVFGLVVITALILRIVQPGDKQEAPVINNNQASSSANISTTTETGTEVLVGSDRDEHGCIGSAGYIWCDIKQKCLRVWEEDCPIVVEENTEAVEMETIEVAVSVPLPGDLIVSPLIVSGKARGGWFFEASLPVSLIDEDGSVIVSHYGQAESDWMTADFVPFRSELVFETQATTGYLVIAKDNPSGLPENDDKIMIPVKFK